MKFQLLTIRDITAAVIVISGLGILAWSLSAETTVNNHVLSGVLMLAGLAGGYLFSRC